MLVLDCSQLIGTNFVNMKTAANPFIETLRWQLQRKISAFHGNDY